MQEYYTVTEVAQMKNVNQETVRRWLRTGRLKGHRLGGTKSGWRIHRKEIFPEEAQAEQQMVTLIKHIMDERAVFDRFVRDTLHLLKKAALQLGSEEPRDLSMANTGLKDAEMTAALWRAHLQEHRKRFEEICRLLEKNYETCKKHRSSEL